MDVQEGPVRCDAINDKIDSKCNNVFTIHNQGLTGSCLPPEVGIRIGQGGYSIILLQVGLSLTFRLDVCLSFFSLFLCLCPVRLCVCLSLPADRYLRIHLLLHTVQETLLLDLKRNDHSTKRFDFNRTSEK